MNQYRCRKAGDEIARVQTRAMFKLVSELRDVTLTNRHRERCDSESLP
jgi:hypothetical protein